MRGIRVKIMPMSQPAFQLRRVAAFAGMFVLILFVIEFNARLEKLGFLEKQRDDLRVEATQSIQTQVALQTQAAYAASTEAVEDWARSDERQVQEGDHPVIPVGQPGSEPVIANTPIPVPTPMQNWEIWRALFFDR